VRAILTLLPGLVLVAVAILWTGSAQSDGPESRAAVPGRRERFAFTDPAGFDPLPEPGPRDWLALHDEPGQTFAEYVASRPTRASGRRHVLAFLPVGRFTEDQAAVARATYEFAGIWFDLPVRVLEPVSLPSCPEPVLQIRTDWFLRRLLPPRLPEDAAQLTAVTAADLYPSPGWNYVFGIASFRRRVAVYSIARHFPEFWGLPPGEAARTLALRRSLALVAHELGHTFGLAHCIAWSCTMNGSNSLEESDRQPLALCPQCLRKLAHNRGFDVLVRYRRLLAFYERNALTPEAEWTAARIRRIEAVR
jgi:archaemetzincin